MYFFTCSTREKKNKTKGFLVYKNNKLTFTTKGADQICVGRHKQITKKMDIFWPQGTIFNCDDWRGRDYKNAIFMMAFYHKGFNL